MPLNENTRNYFKRYSKFYLKNDDACWRVEAIDWISTPGILEIAAVEYYANEFEDDIEQGIVDGLIEEIKDPNEEDNTIIGETFIKVRTPAPFRYKGSQAAFWSVDKKYPVNLSVDKNDPRNVIVTWDSSFSGQFELCYGDFASKTIVVESLF